MPDEQVPVSGDLSGLLGPENITTNTTSVQDIPDWYKPYVTQYLSTLQKTLMPGGQMAKYPYPNHQVAAFNPLQQAGQEWTIQRALGGAPLQAAGDQGMLNTLSGNYLYPGSNPYLDATYNQAAQGVANQYKYGTAPSTQAAFNRAGAFGGSAQQQTQGMQQFDLGQNLNNLATDIYGGNYQQERQRQTQTQAIMPQYMQSRYTDPNALMQQGGMDQALQQQMLDAQYTNQYDKANWPYQVLNMLKGGMTGLNVGGTTTGSSTAPNPSQLNPLANILGLMMLGGNGGGIPGSTGNNFSSLLPFLS